MQRNAVTLHGGVSIRNPNQDYVIDYFTVKGGAKLPPHIVEVRAGCVESLPTDLTSRGYEGGGTCMAF